MSINVEINPRTICIIFGSKAVHSWHCLLDPLQEQKARTEQPWLFDIVENNKYSLGDSFIKLRTPEELKDPKNRGSINVTEPRIFPIEAHKYLLNSISSEIEFSDLSSLTFRDSAPMGVLFYAGECVPAVHFLITLKNCGSSQEQAHQKALFNELGELLTKFYSPSACAKVDARFEELGLMFDFNKKDQNNKFMSWLMDRCSPDAVPTAGHKLRPGH